MIGRLLMLGLAAVTSIGALAPPPANRPAITGVSHLAVYTADPSASERFYTGVLGARKGADPEDAAGTRYYLSGRQFVEVLPLPAGHGAGRLAHVAFATSDADGLRVWLATRGAAELSTVRRAAGGDRWFEASDPEGNRVQFVQSAAADAAPVAGAISGRIIHLGFAVHDRAGEDGFFRRLLGFRPYWYGAFDPAKVDWVSQQVPDGRDWLEYMMVGPGSDVPLSKVDANQLGVMNHLSLGVPNMEAAVTRLLAEDRLSPRHDGPQMGRDGKWQANLYDPDGTRVELMEFQPAIRPCCSPFTAESPTR